MRHSGPGFWDGGRPVTLGRVVRDAQGVQARFRSGLVTAAPALAVLAAACAAGGALAEGRLWSAPGDQAFVSIWVLVALLGALLTRRVPNRAVGPIVLASGLAFCIAALAQGWAVRALRLDPGLPLGSPAAWVATWIGTFSVGLVPLVILALPTGDPPRRAALSIVVACVAVAAAQSVAVEPLEGVDPRLRPIPNPGGVAGLADAVGVVTGLGVAVLLLAVVFGAARVVSFARRSREASEQLRWVSAGVLLIPVTFVVTAVVEGLGGLAVANALSLVGYGAALVLLIAALITATARHRLYALDALVDRTVVFALLTALGVLVYGGIVGLANLLFTDSATTGASLLATAVVAVSFGSARTAVGRWTSLLLFGPRTEPYEVLAALGARLEATISTGEVLPELVGALAEALDVDGVAIDLREGDDFVEAAAAGAAVDSSTVAPIVASGEVVGQLRVGRRRASGVAIEEAERRLLDDVARQAAVAIQGVRMFADLQRSRAEVVQGREEERRRLQRDLHDGLGPALAGLVLEAEAAQRLVETSPAAARAAMGELVGQLKSATTEVRRISRGLRPAVLDQLGLVGALREHAASFMADGRLAIELDADPDVRVPAAFEVAAYRIACEAMTNVVRHAGATRCRVAITCSDQLAIDITDDGVGPGALAPSGIGLRSIRDRAAELGSSVTIGPAAGGRGTHVALRMPLP